jgi:DNA modification methylase
MIHQDGEWLPYWDGWIAWMRAQGWRRFGWYVWDQTFGMPGANHGRLADSHEFIFHFNKVADRTRKTVAKLDRSTKLRVSHVGRTREGAVYRPTLSSTDPYKVPDSVIRGISRHQQRGIEMAHPAVFPVALPTEFIKAFSDPGDIVIDPFIGSGSTLLAAEITDRFCLGIEIAPAYCDVVVKRWENLTGQKASR